MAKNEVRIMEERLVEVRSEKGDWDDNITGLDNDPLLMEAATCFALPKIVIRVLRVFPLSKAYVSCT